MPTITDGNGPLVMAGYLADPVTRSQHVDAIVGVAQGDATSLVVDGKRLAAVGPLLDLMMIVILVLMTFKPGGPSI